MKFGTKLVLGFYGLVALCSIIVVAMEIDAYQPRPACAVVEKTPDASPEDRARCQRMRGHRL